MTRKEYIQMILDQGYRNMPEGFTDKGLAKELNVPLKYIKKARRLEEEVRNNHDKSITS